MNFLWTTQNNIITRLFEEIKNASLTPEEKLYKMIPDNLKFVIHELQRQSLC